MLITCTTRGCLKQSEAKLIKDTGEVICEECGNAIEGITKYMKKTLESMGQVTRSVKKQAFQALCPNCHKNQSLVIRDNKAYCKECDTQVMISSAFMQGLKLYADAQAKSDAAEAVEEAKAQPKKAAKKDKDNA
jgi:hypothetical protein